MGPSTKIRENNIPLLSYAADVGLLKIVDYLLRQEDDFANIRDNVGNTPLSAAARGNSLEVMDLLLKHPSFDVNAKNILGPTPLLVALYIDSALATERLLRHPNIAINALNQKGFTALHFAITKSLILVKMLSEAGADYNAQTTSGLSVLYSARRAQRQEIADYLVSLGAKDSHNDVEKGESNGIIHPPP